MPRRYSERRILTIAKRAMSDKHAPRNASYNPDADPHDMPDDEEEFEAYCMSCRAKTPMENPQPIWTRRGTPGLRGTCAHCGTTVFRMGKTAAHARLRRPKPVQVAGKERARGGLKLPTSVTYINYSVTDAEFAEILAEDLNRIGMPTWLATTRVDDVQWATGVHPALVECDKMIVVLTPLAAKATHVQEALQFFLERGKPVVVALLEETEIPDALRRKPRFDFRGDDYKQQFRQMVEALSD